jgi:hypothetical protein
MRHKVEGGPQIASAVQKCFYRPETVLICLVAILPLYHKWYKCTIYGTVLKHARRRSGWSESDGCARKWRAQRHISPVDSAQVAQEPLYPLQFALNELKTQNSLRRSRDVGMAPAVLFAGVIVRGKTKAVLNKRGIIESINGNVFNVKWEGETQAQPCTKNAIQVWVDGQDLAPRVIVRRTGAADAAGAAAAQPAAENREDDHSEQGSVMGDGERNEDNGQEPEDLRDDVVEDGQAVGQNAERIEDDDAQHRPEAQAPNIVQPNQVIVERRQGARVVESRVWVEQEISISLETDKQVWSRPPKLLWAKNKYTANVDSTSAKTALQYYMLFQSPEALDLEVECTNRNLRMRTSEPAAATPLTVPELLRKRGIRLSMVLEPLRGGGVADYWSSTMMPGTFQQARCYGKRMGMSRHRFEVLESAMQFCNADSSDRWWPIRQLLTLFNEHMKGVFVAGKWVTIDESGFWWLGKDGQWHHDGMPHVTKIIRKPRSVMAELKSLADAITGIMIALELQEGKDAMKTKEFACPPESYPHHVALDLRLTKVAGLHGSGRVLVGDSYFSSVTALQRLHEHGLFFWGIVKTASALYPMRVLKQKSEELDAPNRRQNRGRHNTFVSEYDVAGQPHKMAAIAWHDLKTKYLITNVGNTLPGPPLVRKRCVLEAPADAAQAALCTTREVQFDIPQPSAVAEGFKHFSAIDMHNDYRQGILKIEEYYKTHSWYKRMAASLEGMCLVNAYLAYKFDTELRRGDPEDYFTFCHRVAFQLVHNPYLPSGRQRNRSGNDDDFVGVAGVGSGNFHFICNPSRKPKCFSAHVQRVLGGDFEE